MPKLTISSRVRPTPFTKLVESDKENPISAYSVYNHMILPAAFQDVVADYWHLKQYVQLWDVSVERQIAIKGKDAAHLVQLMTPRFLGNQQINQCVYAPLCDEFGGMINDPVVIKLANDYYWLSIADSDVLLWAKGLAYGLKLNVEIYEEQNVAPLAIQGPKSNDVAAKLFGDSIRDLKFFYADYVDYQGYELLIARSGFSKQGGFEIYLDKPTLAEPLWHDIMRAGKEFNIRQGGPHTIERIEGGMLSYGGDMKIDNNPFEMRLDKFVNLNKDFDCISRDALLKIQQQGIKQRIEGVIINSDDDLNNVGATDVAFPTMLDHWAVHNAQGDKVGYLTALCHSPAFARYIAFAMLNVDCHDDNLHVESPIGKLAITIDTFPFTLPK